MKSRAVGSLLEWDEVRMVESEAGRYLGGLGTPSSEAVRKGSEILASIPYPKTVEVTTGEDWFGLTLGPDEAHGQLALASLARGIRYQGWTVSNMIRRFSPSLALYVARRYGRHTLGWRTSWFKIIAPRACVIERRRQRHPESVDNMLATLAGRPPVMDIETFTSLTKDSVFRATPPEERAARLIRSRR